ncbi:MAG: endonuclease/exonuclease/phosphatase family protein [Porphyromonas sp.]|nr:endonuclease/exonuclease/phosphatase family protein [Porphyromonas sp.]
MKRRHFIQLLCVAIISAILFSCGSSYRTQGGADTSQYNAYAVAFYNLENLFDTEDDPNNPGDDDFLPTGPYHWTQTRYEQKLDNIASVLSQLARNVTPVGPVAIGVSELENKRVLDDLVARPAVRSMGLAVIHEEGPDRRGIDVGLLYNPNIFKVDNHNYHVYPPLEDQPNFRTRNQLMVSGMIGSDRLHLIVAHWPSRYGGSASGHLREKAAELTRHIMDSIYMVEPDAKIIFMGDLNDDPTNKSVVEVLQAKSRKEEVRHQGLYNPSRSLFDSGVGTLAYQNKWNFFDQMIVSHGLLTDDYNELGYWKMEVFNRPFLIQQEGRYKGYPHRTFDGNTFINGYSDHFPVITYLLRRR